MQLQIVPEFYAEKWAPQILCLKVASANFMLKSGLCKFYAENWNRQILCWKVGSANFMLKSGLCKFYAKKWTLQILCWKVDSANYMLKSGLCEFYAEKWTAYCIVHILVLRGSEQVLVYMSGDVAHQTALSSIRVHAGSNPASYCQWVYATIVSGKKKRKQCCGSELKMIHI